MYKIGEYVVCVDVTQKPFRGRKQKNITTLSLGNKYEIVNIPDYTDRITVINDKGIRSPYAPRRFKSIQKFRNYKLNKITKRLKKCSTYD